MHHLTRGLDVLYLFPIKGCVKDDLLSSIYPNDRRVVICEVRDWHVDIFLCYVRILSTQKNGYVVKSITIVSMDLPH